MFYYIFFVFGDEFSLLRNLGLFIVYQIEEILYGNLDRICKICKRSIIGFLYFFRIWVNYQRELLVIFLEYLI